MKKPLLMNIIKNAMFLSIILLLVCVFMSPTAASASSVDLSWGQNSEPNIVGYKIYYGTTTDVYPNSVDIHNNVPDQTDGRIHGTVTGLTDGTTYYFVCTAYNDQGSESDFSNEVVFSASPLTVSPTITSVKIQ